MQSVNGSAKKHLRSLSNDGGTTRKTDGPALTGRAVRLWAGLDRVHVLLDGYRVKTLPSRLDARDLARPPGHRRCPRHPLT
jgi:hypothetical protein